MEIDVHETQNFRGLPNQAIKHDLLENPKFLGSDYEGNLDGDENHIKSYKK